MNLDCEFVYDLSGDLIYLGSLLEKGPFTHCPILQMAFHKMKSPDLFL